NFASAFPQLCSYQQWIARLHRLSPLIGRLFESARVAGRCKLYLAEDTPPGTATAPVGDSVHGEDGYQKISVTGKYKIS
ncbi:MAG: hypothetical protein WBV94_32610, partial [Blastocatellia bacterium]